MDPALLELASYTANGTLYAWAGVVFIYLCMNACFARRGHTALFWGYFLFKGFAMSAFDAANVLGVLDDALYALYVGITCIFALASYVVLYCAWNTEVLKIGVAGIIIDLAASSCVLASLLVVDGLLGQNPTLDYTGPFGWKTVLLSGMYLAGCFAFRLLLAPLARWINGYEFKHRRLWQAFVVCLIASLTVTRFSGFSDFGLELLTVSVEIPLLAGASGAYVAARVHSERKRHRALQRTGDLMKSYDLAIREQGEALAENREALDALAAQVRQLEAEGGRDALLAALQDLRRTSDRIRYGVHSDCPALDAVLAHAEGSLHEKGLRADFAIAPFGAGHTRLAQAIHQVLGWAVKACTDAGRHAGRHAKAKRAELPDTGQHEGVPDAGRHAEAPDATLRLQASRAGNQVFLLLEVPMARNANFPHRVLDDVLASPATVVEGFQDGHKKLLLMFEEA